MQLGKYPERESKTLEFKEVLPSFSDLIKTCVAFANTAGGQIIIGVEDATRIIVGVKDSDREKLYESFPNSLYDSTNNGLFAHIYERNFNDKSVLVIEVPLSMKRPCFVKQEGIPKGIYLRLGTSTRRAQAQHIDEMMRETKHQYFDQESTALSIEDLSERRLRQCYGSHYSLKKLESDGVIVRKSANPERYFATVAGSLMFYDSPERIIPEAIVICTQFSGVNGRKIIQTREFLGPVPEVISESLSVLEYWLQRKYELKGARLVGSTLLPMVALREALINALIHRKYTIPGATKVALYDDRLEIFNPGGFPGLIDINHLGDGTTYLRNPYLAKIARRYKLIEKLGTGIKLIFEACGDFGLKKPDYQENGDFVKLIFYFSLSCESNIDDSEKIMKWMQATGEASISAVMTLLDVSRNTATRKLNELVKKHLVVRVGKGPAVKYVKRQ